MATEAVKGVTYKGNEITDELLGSMLGKNVMAGAKIPPFYQNDVDLHLCRIVELNNDRKANYGLRWQDMTFYASQISWIQLF